MEWGSNWQSEKNHLGCLQGYEEWDVYHQLLQDFATIHFDSRITNGDSAIFVAMNLS